MIAETIKKKLGKALFPEHLEVINESANHNVPAGSESHFKLIVVTTAFDGLSKIARHRRIHAILAQELAESIHALTLHLYTPDDWQALSAVPQSPPCHGGEKK